jgi:hypothetical protein
MALSLLLQLLLLLLVVLLQVAKPLMSNQNSQ